MQLVIAEKPSVGVALAKALGVTNKKDGYIEGKHNDGMNEIINSILVKDNRFIWNFNFNRTANADMNISIEGNKRKKQCPVITIDGEIMGTPSGVPDFSVFDDTTGIPSGVPDFLHISGNNSLDLPAEIRNNPLFAKKASLLLHLHTQEDITLP